MGKGFQGDSPSSKDHPRANALEAEKILIKKGPAMPVTLYTDEEVQVYTRLLARAYDYIRKHAPADGKRWDIQRAIEQTLGWRGPPPETAPPPDHERELAKMIDGHFPSDLGHE
jgi:hypothetical protein